MLIKYLPDRNILLSIFILLSSFFTLFIIVYFRPFLGDDVLGFFDGAISFYTKPFILGERFTSIQQIVKSVFIQYMTWDGRVLPDFVGRIITMFHPIINAFIVTTIYVGIVILSLRLVCGNLKDVLKNPAYLAFFCALFLFYGKSMDYAIMRTMAVLYGLSFLLYLILLNYTNYILENKNISLKIVILFNIIAFLSAMTHELFGAWFIIIIFIHITIYKGIKGFLYKLKYYIGLLVGYPICFFAPGNFNRLHNPHDAGIFRPYNVKLHASYDRHVDLLSPCEFMGDIIYYVLLFFVVLCIFDMLRTEKNIQRAKYTLLQCLEIFSYIVISVRLWACVSYVPVYAMIGPLAFKYIICFKLIHNGRKVYKMFFSHIALFLFILTLVDMGTWCQSMVHTSKIWRENIKIAISQNKKEVHVPAFKTNRRIMFLSYVNEPKRYAPIYYIKYYGIKIIVDK